ncbi:translocation/assembly module TamB domain-containing protein [Nitrincola sp.]|uniref:translocation/assembly module TamB domain-containing protein n=1 Tax=Nitrincola sp. TaxID=1926584 RepID=UPI003A911D8F
MRLKRLLLIPLLVVLLIVYLLLALLYLPGVAGLGLKISQGFLPDSVKIGSVSGALTNLRVEQVDYDQNGTHITLEQLALDWKPACLLQMKVCVENLHLDQLTVQLPASQQTSEEASAGMPELPEITLPVQLELQSLVVTDIELHQGEQQFNLEKFSASAFTRDQTLVLQDLQVLQGNTRLEMQAELEPIADYNLVSDISWHIELTDIETILNQELTHPVTAPVTGQLRLSGSLQDLQLALDTQTATDITGALTLQLRAEVQPFREMLSLERLALTLPDSESAILLSGQVAHWADPELELTLGWNNLHYPILLEEQPAQFASPQGEITLAGRLSDYALQLDTVLQGADLPDVNLAMSATGDIESMRDINLLASLLGGEVEVSGRAGWSEQPEWQTRIEVRNFDPEFFNPELSGLINLELQSQGKVTESGPALSVELLSLNGVLREQSLSGQGRVNYTPEQILVDELNVSLGGAQALINGTLINEQLAMRVQLSAPDLSLLLPEAAGEFHLAGEVNGPMNLPAIRADLEGRDLRFQQHRVLTLEGHLRTDLSGSEASELDLELNDLMLAGQSLDSVVISGSGRPEAHNVRLDVVGDLLDLSLALRGAWEQPGYQARLSDLEIFREEAGRWTQADASQISFEAPVFSLTQTCLLQEAGSAELCLGVSRNASDRLSAEFSLTQLSLDLLDPFLQGNQIESELSLNGRFSQQGSQHPEAEVLLTTSAGRLLTADDQPNFDLDPIELRVNLAKDQLRADLNANFSEMDGRVLANLNIQQLSSQQLLDGELDISLNDLTLVSVFAPNAQNVAGNLQGRLFISGSLPDPAVRGSLQLNDGSVDLPAQGITLTPLQFELLAEGEQAEILTLEGLVGSGEGEIKLQGQFNLESLQGELSLQGEDFQAMNTEIQLLISPDLSIRVDDAIRVGGSVTVPYALISPPRSQMQNVVRASDDVVFTDQLDEPLTERNLPLLTDIELILGDSVRVDAFGFKGRLLGRLRIQDDAVTATRASGSIQVESGDYRLFGQEMTIQRGNLIFSGGPIENPGLDLRVARTVDTVVAGARIGGTIQVPEFTLFSTPAMPDSSIMSYLVLGRGPGDSSASEQSMMLQAAMSLSMQGGNNITGQLRDELSLDEFGFASDDTGDSAFFIGKYLTPRLYIRYGVSLLESVDVLTLSYRLSSMWKVETQSSSMGSGADFFYTRER